MPVGRVKDRSPLGHSGQRRLQEVVGSTLRLMGHAANEGRVDPASRALMEWEKER